MSTVSGLGPGPAAPAGRASAAGQGEDRTRFGLALWLAMTAPLSDAVLGLGTGPAAAGGGARRDSGPSASRSPLQDSFASRDRAGSGTGPARSPDSVEPGGGTRERGRANPGPDRVERAGADGRAGHAPEASTGGRTASPGDARTVPAGVAAGAAAAAVRTGGASAEPVEGVTAAATVRGPGARNAPAPEPAEPPAGEAAAARAQKLAKQAGRGSGFVLVPFQDEEGAEGRVRLSVRGSALNATILSSDRDAVAQLGRRLGELHRALAARGFTDTQLNVREHRAAPSNPGQGTPQDHPGHSGRENPERGSREGTGRRSSAGASRFTLDTRQVNDD